MREPKIKISKMSGKLDGIPAINSNTLTNPFCQIMQKNPDNVCSKCYSQYMLTHYRKASADPYQMNDDLMTVEILPTAILPIINAAYVRLNAHGELKNEIHYINYLNIVRKNPHATFSLWSKRKDIIKNTHDRQDQPKPANLILIYSEPRLDNVRYTPPPVYFDKIFYVISPDNTEHQVNCSDKCLTCRKCYRPTGPEHIIERLTVYPRRN